MKPYWSGLLLIFCPVFCASATSLSISNDALKVSYDDASNQFSIDCKNPVVHITGTLPITGTVSLSTEHDPSFGSGQALKIQSSKTESARIILFPNTPFAVFRRTIANSTTDPQTLNQVPFITFSPDLGLPLTDLKVRAYSGLTTADKVNPGDYEWLALGDPKTRAGVVAGFISQWRSTGILVRSVDSGKLTVTARSEYGRLLLDPGQSTDGEVFAIGIFPDVRLGLESYADQLVKTYHIQLHPEPAGYCTWYSDKHGRAGDERSLAELGSFVSEKLKPFGMSFVQIDDGWQMGNSHGNGPNKNFTQFNPKGPYSSGMKATADTLKKLGLTPGIWFMPFAGSYKDDWFADKQDLFVKKADGTPFDTSWGGTCLDMTNPATQEYLKNEVSQLAHDWGYTYFKMDGFSTGAADQPCYVNVSYKDTKFGSAVFHDPHRTNVEALRMGINVVRESAGPDVFFLGCCVAQNMRSYGGSFGTLDAMRVGPDNNGSWGGWSGDSPLFGGRNYFLNGRVWYNDPDPCYVRSELSLDQARTASSWVAISGQLYTNSDWMPDLPAERLDIIKRTVEPHGKTARPVDFLENDPPTIWQVTDTQSPTRRDVIALYNFTKEPKTFSIPISQLDLPKSASYAAFDFWGKAELGDVTDTLTATLPPTSCQIIAIRPMLDHPFVISTSRHVTQGMIDLSDETWDAATKTLSGKSQVIAGDAYELRLVKTPQSATWTAKASVDSADATITTTATEKNFLATIASKSTGTVTWHIQFAAP